MQGIHWLIEKFGESCDRSSIRHQCIELFFFCCHRTWPARCCYVSVVVLLLTNRREACMWKEALYLTVASTRPVLKYNRSQMRNVSKSLPFRNITNVVIGFLQFIIPKCTFRITYCSTSLKACPFIDLSRIKYVKLAAKRIACAPIDAQAILNRY
jgi:hypothetical protein